MNDVAMPILSAKPVPVFSWKWLARFATVVLLCDAIILSGCTFASFVAAAEADLPVVISMVTNITNIIAPGISAAAQTAGGLALAALQVLCGNPAPGAAKCDATSLIGQYQAASDPTVKTTLLQKIQAGLATVQTHLNDIVAVASTVHSVSSSVVAALTTAVGLALSTIISIMSMIPPSAAPAAVKRTMALASKPMSAKQLRTSYNAAVTSYFPKATI